MRNCQIYSFMHVKIIQKNAFVENVWPANLALLVYVRPIASRKLNGLTTLYNLSWLGGAVVTHPLWVQEVPCSIPSSGKDFYVWFFCIVVVVFLLFCQKITLFVTQVCNSFYNFNLFSILDIARFMTDYKGIKIQTKHLEISQNDETKK